jgi:hypothetical protein
VPAAAVIPAPVAYIDFVAVKKLVVGSEVWVAGAVHSDTCATLPYTVIRHLAVPFAGCS